MLSLDPKSDVKFEVRNLKDTGSNQTVDIIIILFVVVVFEFERFFYSLSKC